MAPVSVAAFTDTYLPTVNGVSYTIQTWRDRWRDRGGTMRVVYPGCDEYEPGPDEYPVRSLPFPMYEASGSERRGYPPPPRTSRSFTRTRPSRSASAASDWPAARTSRS